MGHPLVETKQRDEWTRSFPSQFVLRSHKQGPAASPRPRVAQSALAQRGAAAAGEGGGGGDGGVRGPSEGLLVAEILVDGGGGGGKPGRRRGARDVDTVAVAVPVVIVGLPPGARRARPFFLMRNQRYIQYGPGGRFGVFFGREDRRG